MNSILNNKNFKSLSLVYGLIILILAVVAYLKAETAEYVLRIICIPTLMVLYFIISNLIG